MRDEVPIPVELVGRLRAAEAHRAQPRVVAESEVEVRDEIARIVGRGYAGFGSAGGGPVVGHRYGPVPHPRPNPMIALGQLRAADIPDLPRPGCADLLQVLWCPDHHTTRPPGPNLQLRWRREGEIGVVLADPPTGEVGRDDSVPVPCRLHPEQVVEYPYPHELPSGLGQRDGRSAATRTGASPISATRPAGAAAARPFSCSSSTRRSATAAPANGGARPTTPTRPRRSSRPA